VITAGALLKESLMTSFFDFILLISTLFIPLFAIMLTDFFVIKKGNYDGHEICNNTTKQYNYYHGFNLVAIASYLISAIFAYYFTYISPLAVGSSIPTLFFSIANYYLLTMFFSSKEQKVVCEV
jgi:purine-cytosine permease-like protein